MSTSKTEYIGLVLIALLLSGCGNMTKGKAAAQSQIPVFHEQFNAGNLQAIVDGAHPDLMKTTSAAEVTNFIGVVRKKLGKVTDSQTQNWSVKTFNGATTVTLIQNTTFEQGRGTETFTFRIQKEQGSLLGYNISSQDLIMK